MKNKRKMKKKKTFPKWFKKEEKILIDKGQFSMKTKIAFSFQKDQRLV